MLIDNHAIARGDALRAELDLAAKTKAWEAKNGPVQTLPTRVSSKPVPFRISCPDLARIKKTKAQATKASARSLKARRAEKIKAVRSFLDQPRSATELSELTGINATTVRSILKELGVTPMRPEPGRRGWRYQARSQNVCSVRAARDRAVLREVWS